MNKSTTAIHQVVVTTPRVIGGAAIACRCGHGKWFETATEAHEAAQIHAGEPHHAICASRSGWSCDCYRRDGLVLARGAYEVRS